MSASKKDAPAFSFTTMLALVLVGVLCLAGIGLLSAYQPELKSGNDGQAHALSKSSVGYLALTRLLEKNDHYVFTDRKGVREDNIDGTFIITPDAGTVDEQILAFFSEGPTVLILPKWLVARDENKRGWANLISMVPEESALNLLPEDMDEKSKLVEAREPLQVNLAYKSPFGGGARQSFGMTKPIKNLRSLSGADWTSVLSGPNNTAIIAKHKTYNLYVVADPDVANNAAMGQPANAAFMEYFLTDISNGEDAIIFDLTLNGFQRQPNLGRLLIQPPLLGATLCFVLAGILVAIQAAIRFLPPLEAGRVVALGKRVLADNTAGLIRMGRREHHMALPYANMVKRQVAKAVGIPPNPDAAAQTATLDRVSELSQSGFRFSNLVADAAAAPDPDALMVVAKNLHIWKQETTREHQ
jgi:hypothetical protein